MTGELPVIDHMLSGVRLRARARSAVQSPRRWPRRRDGALVASLSGRAARAHDRLAVMSCIITASSSRRSASAVAQDEQWQEAGQPPHSHVRARLRGG